MKKDDVELFIFHTISNECIKCMNLLAELNFKY